MLAQELAHLGHREDVVQSPGQVNGFALAPRLIQPRQRKFADDGVVFQPLRFLELDKSPDADDMKSSPFPIDPLRGFRDLFEGTNARWSAENIQKHLGFIHSGKNKMKTMSASQIIHRECRSQFVVAHGAVPKSGEESTPVLIRWIDPKVNVFRECGGAVEN